MINKNNIGSVMGNFDGLMYFCDRLRAFGLNRVSKTVGRKITILRGDMMRVAAYEVHSIIIDL